MSSFLQANMMKIKLKKDLTPQKTAEQYYRKAKNQKIEKEEINKQYNHSINESGSQSKNLYKY